MIDFALEKWTCLHAVSVLNVEKLGIDFPGFLKLLKTECHMRDGIFSN